MLSNVIGAGEDFLDNQSLVSNLKEAKAKVFESHNDLVAEKKNFSRLSERCAGFHRCARRLLCFIGLCETVRDIDPSFDFVPDDVFDLLQEEDANYTIDGLYGEVVRRFLDSATLSVLPSLRRKLTALAELVQLLPIEADEVAAKSDFEQCMLDADATEEACVKSLSARHAIELPGGFLTRCRRAVEDREEKLVEVLLERSRQQPLIVLTNAESEALLTVPSLIMLLIRRRGGGEANKKAPEYYSGAEGSVERLNEAVRNAGKAGRWMILDNVQTSQHCLDQELI